MHRSFLAGAELRFRANALTTTRGLTCMPFATTALQQVATCALATAVVAEANDQRVTQRIKDRRTERFR